MSSIFFLPHLAAFLLILLTASAPGASSEDWPQFRGPGGQGHSQLRELPLAWNSTNGILWRQTIPGQGWSSPVAVRGRVIVTTALPAADDTGFSLHVICADALAGSILWNTEALTSPASRGTALHRKNSQASPTPIIEGDRVYAHFGHHGTACLDLDGRIIWSNTELEYPPTHGNGGSPVLSGSALVFSCDGERDPFIVALHKSTGRLLWRVPRPTSARKTFSFSTPLLITLNGEPQLITPGSGVVMALNPADGNEIWRVTYGEGYSVVPRPVFGHGLVFIGTGFDRPSILAIRPDGTGNITDTHVTWTATRGAPNTPSTLLVGDELYLVSDSGMASCLDARTGQSHWMERIGGNYSASPIFADGRIYFFSEEGVATVLTPGKSFARIAVNDLAERVLASPAVVPEGLIVRTEKHLLRIGKTGAQTSQLGR